MRRKKGLPVLVGRCFGSTVYEMQTNHIFLSTYSYVVAFHILKNKKLLALYFIFIYRYLPVFTDLYKN